MMTKAKRSVTVTTRDIAAETKKKTKTLGLKKRQDQRSKARQLCRIRPNLNKTDDDFKSSAVKKQSSALSENPRSLSHEAGENTKQNLKKKPDVCCKSVPATSASRPLQMKKKQPPLKVSPAMRKNATETLELFEIAKKSADVANAKGLLLSKEETSICVDTLSLLIGFPISSTAPETRRIMERLAHLTKHKDRKICSSARELLHHWSQSIRDQQHNKTQGY